METDELDYDLPESLIAQRPAEDRDAARLLLVRRGDGAPVHHHVRDLPSLLRPALFVVNDTRVIPARLFGRKESGGKVELLLVQRHGLPGTEETWMAMGRASKPIRAGAHIQVDGGLRVLVEEKLEGGRLRLRLTSDRPVAEVLEAVGHVPLPPYVRRDDEDSDRERYQTVFAREDGAVAAPTAGLHFTERLLTALEAAGHQRVAVTLHVGPGTFRPVSAARLEDHDMHEERYVVPQATVEAIAAAKRDGRPVVAVGTTVVRTLESAARPDGSVAAGPGETALLIQPPYAFRVVDALMTNFHLPRSTLLALVMAFGGVEPLRAAYAEAVAARYRFFSYGDAMLIAGEDALTHEGHA